MTIRYALVLEDLVAFNRYHWGHSASYKRMLSRAVWTGMAVIVLVLSLLFHGGGLMVSVPLAVLYRYLFYRGMRHRIDTYARKVYTEGANRSLIGPHELTLSSDALIESNPLGGQTVALKAIEKIDVADGYAYIYFNATMAFPVPRKSVQDGNLDAFLDELMRSWQAIGGTPSTKV